MKLTTQGRYAVTAMLDMALNGATAPCSLSEISARQSISRNYLEQIFLKLRRGKLVYSVRGPGGGYRLSRPAEQISVSQIICAVDKPVDMTRCSGEGNCQGGDTCLTHHLWEDLNCCIRSFLSNISLAQLERRQEIRSICDRQRRQQAAAAPSQRLRRANNLSKLELARAN